MELGKWIIIGNNVWIGGGVIVFFGVILGDNVVVVVGVVVIKLFLENCVIVGNLVWIIKELIEDDVLIIFLE